jgi:transcriptional regulator with XRE-family HTH domain
MTKYPSGNADSAIGKKIKDRRKALKITQSQLAATVGVTAQQIQKYESGISRISVHAFVKICNGLNTRPEKLLSNFSFCEGTQDSDQDIESRLLEIFKMVENPKVKARILDLVEALIASEYE